MNSGNKTHYRCDSVQGSPKKSGPDCINLAYHIKVTNAYKEAIKCVNSVGGPKVGALELIPTLNHEARFQINQFNNENGNPSVGITQLYTALYKSSGNFKGFLGDIKNELNKMQTSKSCRLFKEHLSVKALGAVKGNECQLLHPSQNPEKSHNLWFCCNQSGERATKDTFKKYYF